jgi:predicted helicase
MNFPACDRLILESNSWAEFTSRLDRLPSTTDQGDVFERIVQLQMQTDPIYLAQYKQVWHAPQRKGQLPGPIRRHLNLPTDDEDIDLIAVSPIGEYTAIQAKYRYTVWSASSSGGNLRKARSPMGD